MEEEDEEDYEDLALYAGAF